LIIVVEIKNRVNQQSSKPCLLRTTLEMQIRKLISALELCIYLFRPRCTTPWRRMGEWRYSYRFRHSYSGTRWRWEVASRPGRFTPRGKRPRYPFDRKLSGPQSRSKLSDEEKNTCPCQKSNPGRSAHSPLATTATQFISQIYIMLYTIYIMLYIIAIALKKFHAVADTKVQHSRHKIIMWQFYLTQVTSFLLWSGPAEKLKIFTLSGPRKELSVVSACLLIFQNIKIQLMFQNQFPHFSFIRVSWGNK
jgi:hypothetical protein